MTNQYRRGADLERAAKTDLETDGYWVTRSAGSHSPVDLVALKPGQIIFVQAKRDGRISPAERFELVNLASMIGALPLVAYKAKVGIGYRELTGVGPKDWVVWSADAA